MRNNIAPTHPPPLFLHGREGEETMVLKLNFENNLIELNSPKGAIAIAPSINSG